MRILLTRVAFGAAAFIALVCAGAPSAPVTAAAQDAEAPPVELVAPPVDAGASRITITRDPTTLVTRVAIEAESGKVAWNDVLAGLARAKGYDPDAFAGLFERDAITLDSTATRLQLLALNMALDPSVRLTILAPPPAAGAAAEPRLEITLDRTALLASKRRFQNLMRRRLVERLGGSGAPGDEYGLRWITPLAAAQGAPEAIILVHGFHTGPQNHASLAADLVSTGLPVAEFSYPSDQPIEESARMFAAALKKIATAAPAQKIRVIALSMGGLVVRRAIEDRQLDPGNVAQLIMVGTPNHGSQLAHFGFALEVWQFVADAHERGLSQSFYETVEDGLGEAADDLCPDSLMLRDLNTRPRNARVRYSLLLGTRGEFTPEQLTALRRDVADAGTKNRFVRFFGPKLDLLLEGSDELVRGRGDGVVSVVRGRLDGVDDTMTIDFAHAAIGAQPQTDGDRALRAAILQRMQQPLN